MTNWSVTKVTFVPMITMTLKRSIITFSIHTFWMSLTSLTIFSFESWMACTDSRWWTKSVNAFPTFGYFLTILIGVRVLNFSAKNIYIYIYFLEITYVSHKTCLAILHHKYIPLDGYNNHWHNRVGRYNDHKVGQTWNFFF